MSVKVSVYIATSLDGFIARADGNLDWLDEANTTVPEGEDCGFVEFMNSVDTLLMGRKTYEKVLSFGEWPYGDTPVILGEGIPLYGAVENDTYLTHVRTTAFDFGFVQSTYAVEKGSVRKK